tara:strand:+ start:6543 stop:6893 length:351 start_codon:yes stop_codon:yes gene_type:complete
MGIISKSISFNLVKTINIVPKLNEINYIPDPTQISSSLDNISIVRGIANFLPNIDLIGHQVLLSNKELIPLILEKDNIPDDIKKELILGIIKMTQYGDSFGGILLENYYHIVDKIF